MVEALSQPIEFHIQINKPPITSIVEVVGVVTVFTNAPILKGTSATKITNGADNRMNSQSEVFETTRTPAMFKAVQVTTTASPTKIPRCATANQGNKRTRYKTN